MGVLIVTFHLPCAALIATLGAEHVVEFITPGAPADALSVDLLRTIDGVMAAREVGGRWSLEVSGLARTVPALLALLASRGLTLDELTTHSATLEDVFRFYAGDSLEEGGELRDVRSTRRVARRLG